MASVNVCLHSAAIIGYVFQNCKEILSAPSSGFFSFLDEVVI